MLEQYIANEYFRVLVILAAFVIVGKLVAIFWNRLLVGLTKRITHGALDGHILGKMGRPLNLVIVLVGIYLASKELSILDVHSKLTYDVFYVLFIVLSAFILSKIVTGIIDKWLEVTQRYTRIPELINKFIVISVYILALMMILLHFEVEVTPLLATLGVGGLAVGLALQKTLGDFFAGVHIISDKPITVGDYIQIQPDISGYVEDIGWRSTRIRTLPNNIVVVPNSKLAESVVVNTSLPVSEQALLVECGVAYGSDLEKVEKTTIEVGKKIQKTIDGAVEDFEPFIRYHTFGDSNIQFTIILRVKKFVDNYLVKHEFIKQLKKRFDKEKIEISWPVTKVYLEDTKRKKR